MLKPFNCLFVCLIFQCQRSQPKILLQRLYALCDYFFKLRLNIKCLIGHVFIKKTVGLLYTSILSAKMCGLCSRHIVFSVSKSVNFLVTSFWWRHWQSYASTYITVCHPYYSLSLNNNFLNVKTVKKNWLNIHFL